MRDPVSRAYPMSETFQMKRTKADVAPSAKEPVATEFKPGAAFHQLETRVGQLRDAFLSGRQVGVVNSGTHAVFMYADDLAYRHADPKTKVPRLESSWAPQPAQYPSLVEVYADPAQPLLMRLLAHFWIHQLEVSFIEVGCQYAGTAINVAQYCQQFGRRRVVHVFEPGIAAGLVPYNLRLNRVEDEIVFNRAAATDRTRPLILFSEFGHSENNRVINRDLQSESLSYVTDGIALDDYVAQHDLAPHLLLEVDTQGGEIEVWAGLQRTIARRTVTAIVEFTPHALATRTDPAAWLLQLGQTHLVLDTKSSDAWQSVGNAMTPVDLAQSDAFVEDVRGRPGAYTDLLLVPFHLPWRSALLDMLVAGGSPAIRIPNGPTPPTVSPAPVAPRVRAPSMTPRFSEPLLRRKIAQAIALCRAACFERVAIFGAGGHTRLLLPVWRELGGPEVAVIVESIRTTGSLLDIPVLQAGERLPDGVGAIVPSSHAHEVEMRVTAGRLYPTTAWIPLWNSSIAGSRGAS